MARDAGPPRHQHPPPDDHTHRGLHPGACVCVFLSLRVMHYLVFVNYSNIQTIIVKLKVI